MLQKLGISHYIFLFKSILLSRLPELGVDPSTFSTNYLICQILFTLPSLIPRIIAFLAVKQILQAIINKTKLHIEVAIKSHN